MKRPIPELSPGYIMCVTNTSAVPRCFHVQTVDEVPPGWVS